MLSPLRILVALFVLLSVARGADLVEDAPVAARPERDAKVLEAFLQFETILNEDIGQGSHRHRSFLHRQFEGDKGGLTKQQGGFLIAPHDEGPDDPKQRAAERRAFARDPNNGFEVVANAEGTSFEIFRAANAVQPRVLRAVMVVEAGKLFVKRYAHGW